MSSPLKTELHHLKKRMNRIKYIIDKILDLPQPTCCHYCAFPELHRLGDKLKRQKIRLKYIEKRIQHG